MWMDCYTCKEPMILGSNILKTQCPYGVWYYCPRCARINKGHEIKQIIPNIEMVTTNEIKRFRDDYPSVDLWAIR